MQTGDNRTDAEIARDRAVEAIGTTQDVDLRRALWKAAVKFNRWVKAERADPRLKVSPLHRAAAGGEVPAGAQARYEF